MEERTRVQYVTLCSAVSPGFWSKLSDLKLEVDMLDEKEHHVWGYIFNLNSKHSLSLLQLDSTSFNRAADVENTCIPFHGTLLNKNTVEDFKNCNKNDLVNEQGKRLWRNIENGCVLEQPSMLNFFLVLTFADLKKYHYYYWFAFPVPLHLEIELNCRNEIRNSFTKEELETIYEEYLKLETHQKPFFLLQRNEGGIQIFTHSSRLKQLSASNYTDYYFVFHDTSNLPEWPGTMLRNYVLFILHYCDFLQGKDINFISLRLTSLSTKITCSNRSMIFNFKLPVCDIKEGNVVAHLAEKWIGWEKNETNKFTPRMANLRTTMAPEKLMENSVDLNLKLMKWQLLPEINLDKIKKSRYLLLGSGTLGCSVARTLMGWGARKISFVDNSTVSYSNPIRQSLFTYGDAVSSKPKAVAAAESMKKIFPGVSSQGYSLTIPMPDHPPGQSLRVQTEKDIDTLTTLVKEHDVVFILTDSRESRWLPTLLGGIHEKVVINAALGFDTYLIMRHGASSTIEEEVVPPDGYKVLKGEDLGCYFCSDVTAPGNSLKQRTLDQQCTVTRPGISAIAGAIAVELAISVLQHPLGANAPAFYKSRDDSELFRKDECVLGIVPHSVRGYVSSFSQMLPASLKFKQCTACSDIVKEEYRHKGSQFLFEVFNSSKHLADLTKLDDIHNIDVDISSFSEDDSI